MRIGPKTLLRLLPPALALAGLCAACLWETARIQARAQGYGGKAVVINEICAHNLSGLQDGDGVCKDWIELYNPGGEPVDLSGWSLSDDKDDPGRWVFPAGTVLQDYLVLFADAATARMRRAGTILRSRSAPAARRSTSMTRRAPWWTNSNTRSRTFDITYGRAFGSGEDTGTFATATPGAANPADFLRQEREAPLGTAEFSLPAGFYGDTIELTLQADDPEALIFYTTDGSDPAENGALYTGPLRIKSRAGEPNEYVSLANRFADGGTAVYQELRLPLRAGPRRQSHDRHGAAVQGRLLVGRGGRGHLLGGCAAAHAAGGQHHGGRGGPVWPRGRLCAGGDLLHDAAARQRFLPGQFLLARTSTPGCSCRGRAA